MRMRLLASVALAVWMAGLWGCRGPRQQITPDVRKELDKLQKEKKVLDERLRDIERARSFLADRSKEELDKIRTSIEVLRSASDNMQKSLDALLQNEKPTTAAEPKRLPIEVSVALVLVIAACIVVFVKLRSVRLRETPQTLPEKTSGSTDTQTPSS